MGQIFPGYPQLYPGLQELLKRYLPDRLFDAHLHISEDFGFQEYLQMLSGQLPGLREVGAMLIPMPTKSMCLPGNPERHRINQRIQDQLHQNPGTIGQVFVLPWDTQEELLEMTEDPAIRGLKCYWYSAGKKKPAIPEYLPESAWLAAQEKKMAITLHLARPEAMSDQEDLSYIMEMVRKYPDAKLILAHCGRAFASWTCRNPLEQLQGVENIYYDLSAICEPEPICYCIKYAGCDHVLWGSDYPVSEFRGKAVSLGSGFAWIHEAAAQMCAPDAPVMNILQENLMAVCCAMDLLDLSANETDRIFYGNMCELFG